MSSKLKKSMFRRQVSYRLSKRNKQVPKKRHSQNVEALDLQWTDRQENVYVSNGQFQSSVTKYKSFRVYGHGGDETERFDDWIYGASSSLQGMRLWIRQYGNDRIIAGIQVLYANNCWTKVHGSDKGDLSEFYLDPGEHIIRATTRVHNGLREVCPHCSVPDLKKYVYCPRLYPKDKPTSREIKDEKLIFQKNRNKRKDNFALLRSQTLTTTLKYKPGGLPICCHVRYSLSSKHVESISSEIRTYSHLSSDKEILAMPDQRTFLSQSKELAQTNVCLHARYLDCRKKVSCASLFHGDIIVNDPIGNVANSPNSQLTASYYPRAYQWTPIMKRAHIPEPLSPTELARNKKYMFQEKFEINDANINDDYSQETLNLIHKKDAELQSVEPVTDGTADHSGVIARINFTTKTDGNFGILGPFGGLGCPILQYVEEEDGTMPNCRLSHFSGAVVKAGDGRIALARLRFHWAYSDHGPTSTYL